MATTRRFIAVAAACALLALPGATVSAQSADETPMMDHSDMSAQEGEMAMPSMGSDGQMMGEQQPMTSAETMTMTDTPTMTP